MSVISNSKGSNVKKRGPLGSQGVQIHQARSSLKQMIQRADAVSRHRRTPDKTPKSAARMIGSFVISGLFCFLSLAILCVMAFFCFF
jgi:hypothetical protein